MKLICIFNDLHKTLFDNYFKATIQDDFEIITRQTGQNEFKEIMFEKIDWLIEQIKANLGQPIVMMDVDIQFFGTIKPEVEETLLNCDACFMNAEPSNINPRFTSINGGLIGVNCSEKTLKFFEGVSRTHRSFAHISPLHSEETAINLGLQRYPHFMKTIVLGDQFWCGHRMYHTVHHTCIIPPHPIVLHHATGTDFSFDKKIDQLEMFRKALRK